MRGSRRIAAQDSLAAARCCAERSAKRKKVCTLASTAARTLGGKWRSGSPCQHPSGRSRRGSCRLIVGVRTTTGTPSWMFRPAKRRRARLMSFGARGRCCPQSSSSFRTLTVHRELETPSKTTLDFGLGHWRPPDGYANEGGSVEDGCQAGARSLAGSKSSSSGAGRPRMACAARAHRTRGPRHVSRDLNSRPRPRRRRGREPLASGMRSRSLAKDAGPTVRDLPAARRSARPQRSRLALNQLPVIVSSPAVNSSWPACRGGHRGRGDRRRSAASNRSHPGVVRASKRRRDSGSVAITWPRTGTTTWPSRRGRRPCV